MHPLQTLSLNLIYLQRKQTQIVLGQAVENKRLLKETKMDLCNEKYSMI